jgi:hypothetical protein
LHRICPQHFLSLFPFYSRSVIYADGGGGEKGFFGTRSMFAIVGGGGKRNALSSTVFGIPG